MYATFATLLTGLFILTIALIIVAAGLYLALFTGNPVGIVAMVVGVITVCVLVPPIIRKS
jgi:hypothetical protein